MFVNKKFSQLFGYSLIGSTLAEIAEKINYPCFIKVNNQDADLEPKIQSNPIKSAGRAMINTASNTYLSLKQILLQKTDKLVDDEPVEVYKMV